MIRCEHIWMDSESIISIQSLNHLVDANQTVMFLNGFLQENDEQFTDWLAPQSMINPNAMLYGVHWPSKTIQDLGVLAQDIYQNRNFWQLIHNPWHGALQSAEKSGIQFGQLLADHEYNQLILVGHSLGCRVLYYALATLAQKHHTLSADIILLGGAVGNQSKDWNAVAEYIDGTIYNCFSQEDSVLKYVYSASLAWLSSPVGRYPIDSQCQNIINVDCTGIVNSHVSWKQYYCDIYQHISR